MHRPLKPRHPRPASLRFAAPALWLREGFANFVAGIHHRRFSLHNLGATNKLLSDRQR
jgi:hypothetical protein